MEHEFYFSGHVTTMLQLNVFAENLVFGQYDNKRRGGQLVFAGILSIVEFSYVLKESAIKFSEFFSH